MARYYGYQPARYSLRSNFNDAARNSLSGAPVYPTINDGIPPNVTPQTISSNRPFPNVLLRAVAGQESKWKQFADDEWTDPDEQSFCTLVSPDCGYGIMQQTSNMGGGSWFDPDSVSQYLSYALGTGVGWLIDRWNTMSDPDPWYIISGPNDHTMPEDWYYSVTYYNGWSECNEPNRNYEWVCGGEIVPGLDAWRHPYGEGSTYMPYQEVMNPDGTDRQLLSDQADGGHGYRPYWSPNGRFLAFVSREGGDPNRNNIHLVELETGVEHELLPLEAQHNYDPCWSPDGARLVFVSDRSGADEVWGINADGTGLLQLTDDGQPKRFPLWLVPRWDSSFLPWTQSSAEATWGLGMCAV